jgi:hypothetical protein
MTMKDGTKRRGAATSYTNPPGAFERFDYAAPAEMFMTQGKVMRRLPTTYRRFATAAEAIQFAVEQIPPPLLLGAVMEVAEDRFDHQAIRQLYDKSSYPLARR